jgi:hypothetical protein
MSNALWSDPQPVMLSEGTDSSIKLNSVSRTGLEFVRRRVLQKYM